MDNEKVLIGLVVFTLILGLASLVVGALAYNKSRDNHDKIVNGSDGTDGTDGTNGTNGANGANGTDVTDWKIILKWDEWNASNDDERLWVSYEPFQVARYFPAVFNSSNNQQEMLPPVIFKTEGSGDAPFTLVDGTTTTSFGIKFTKSGYYKITTNLNYQLLVEGNASVGFLLAPLDPPSNDPDYNLMVGASTFVGTANKVTRGTSSGSTVVKIPALEQTYTLNLYNFNEIEVEALINRFVNAYVEFTYVGEQ